MSAISALLVVVSIVFFLRQQDWTLVLELEGTTTQFNQKFGIVTAYN